MSDNIVPIKQTEPHMSGYRKCLSCRHEWISVSVVGLVWAECPACQLQLGRITGDVSETGLHWRCKCGNDLFYIKQTHSYCAACGVTVNGN